MSSLTLILVGRRASSYLYIHMKYATTNKIKLMYEKESGSESCKNVAEVIYLSQ